MEISVREGIDKFLVKLSDEGFFGTVELQFHGGELILVRKQETFKPNFLVVVERRSV